MDAHHAECRGGIDVVPQVIDEDALVDRQLELVEGEGNRFALLTKTHQAMVDGITAVDIGEVILEESAEVRGAPATTWRPAPGPTNVELVAGAVGDVVTHPTSVLGAMRGGLDTARQAIGNAAATVVQAARGREESPLTVDVGQQRRFATLDLRLDDLKDVRRARGGTINDVALAIVAGALRAWLLSRGEPVTHETVVRALVLTACFWARGMMG